MLAGVWGDTGATLGALKVTFNVKQNTKTKKLEARSLAVAPALAMVSTLAKAMAPTGVDPGHSLRIILSYVVSKHWLKSCLFCQELLAHTLNHPKTLDPRQRAALSRP